jgi:hypothetical protein
MQWHRLDLDSIRHSRSPKIHSRSNYRRRMTVIETMPMMLQISGRDWLFLLSLVWVTSKIPPLSRCGNKKKSVAERRYQNTRGKPKYIARQRNLFLIHEEKFINGDIEIAFFRCSAIISAVKEQKKVVVASRALLIASLGLFRSQFLCGKRQIANLSTRWI